MLHGLAISLLESTLVQSPLRLSACAHMHIHTRMRAGSDARLAAARGSGRYSRWTRYRHGCGSYCRTSATRGVGSDSDFQVWGSSDDIALTSPTRGCLSDGPCVHLLCRVPSPRSSGLLVAQCQGWEIPCTSWMCPIGCVYARRVARARHPRVSIPNCPWKQSFEESRTV